MQGEEEGQTEEDESKEDDQPDSPPTDATDTRHTKMSKDGPKARPAPSRRAESVQLELGASQFPALVAAEGLGLRDDSEEKSGPLGMVRACLEEAHAATVDLLQAEGHPVLAHKWLEQACIGSYAVLADVLQNELQAAGTAAGGILRISSDSLPPALVQLLQGPFVTIAQMLYMRRSSVQVQTRLLRLFGDVAGVAGAGVRYGVPGCARLLAVLVGMPLHPAFGRRIPDGNVFCNVKKAAADGAGPSVRKEAAAMRRRLGL